MNELTLVIRFNHFTGKLEDGYLIQPGSCTPVGHNLSPAAVLEHLATYPDARCIPLRV